MHNEKQTHRSFMSRFWTTILGLSAAVSIHGAEEKTPSAVSSADASTTQAQQNIYAFKVKDIHGKEVSLADYKGKALLIVNVASKCGFTKQYEDLQALHEKYAPKGLVILGFPCNQFLGQEPGTSEEILNFCKVNYGVQFPMMEKIKVNGANADPLYIWLKSRETTPAGPGRIKWNFEKFLIGKDGQVLFRYRSKTAPQSEEIIKAIERAL